MWKCARNKINSGSDRTVEHNDVNFMLSGALVDYPHGEEPETILTLKDKTGTALAHLILAKQHLVSTELGLIVEGELADIGSGSPPYAKHTHEHEQWSLLFTTDI